MERQDVTCEKLILTKSRTEALFELFDDLLSVFAHFFVRQGFGGGLEGQVIGQTFFALSHLLALVDIKQFNLLQQEST